MKKAAARRAPTGAFTLVDSRRSTLRRQTTCVLCRGQHGGFLGQLTWCARHRGVAAPRDSTCIGQLGGMAYTFAP